MPNKTIYISDDCLPLLEKASEKHGGNLSSTIVSILRESLEGETRQEAENTTSEFTEVVVEIGQRGCYIKQRFFGRLIAQWKTGTVSKKISQRVRLYQTKKGQYALYIKSRNNWDMDWNDWKNYKSIDEDETGGSKLEVYASIEEFRDRIPKEILPIVEKKLKGIFIEDLDI